jgi:hypothetical protein
MEDDLKKIIEDDLKKMEDDLKSKIEDDLKIMENNLKIKKFKTTKNKLFKMT